MGNCNRSCNHFDKVLTGTVTNFLTVVDHGQLTYYLYLSTGPTTDNPFVPISWIYVPDAAGSAPIINYYAAGPFAAVVAYDPAAFPSDPTGDSFYILSPKAHRNSCGGTLTAGGQIPRPHVHTIPL